MCCTRLTGNAGRKKSPKICRLGTIAQLCQAMSLQLRHVCMYTVIQKKGATLTMAITLSILDRFAKFFHSCKQQ